MDSKTNTQMNEISLMNLLSLTRADLPSRANGSTSHHLPGAVVGVELPVVGHNLSSPAQRRANLVSIIDDALALIDEDYDDDFCPAKPTRNSSDNRRQ